ncbi:hypothetical protein BSM4216_1442 [Bacillus smithii]|jgi:hypothetical protein|nr:hypothetical protein BSM4216_1442 [Bacillus smithii]
MKPVTKWLIGFDKNLHGQNHATILLNLAYYCPALMKGPITPYSFVQDNLFYVTKGA